jgi:hypothetical protein
MFRRADIPLAKFRLQAYDYGNEIKIAWDVTSIVRELFKNEEEIGLDQCDLLKTSIINLRKPVEDFCRLLDPHSDLPMEVVPFRYSLIMALHRIDYLANDLVIIITLYRKVCHTTSRSMLLRRQEINRKLDELTKTIEDIPHIIDVLLFQARYHELAG